ncbi:MAG: hypothetical protein SO468_02320 [Prevotella sp.]|nr:hypothetical protein [Prevotella sp.]
MRTITMDSTSLTTSDNNDNFLFVQMKEYFKGHRDARKINEFLNAHSEDSRDFQIVYRLRRMGERFVDGSLTLQEVEENQELLLHSTGSGSSAQTEVMAFIQEMGGWPFYKALCVITQEGAHLTPLEQRIREEIVHPSFCKPMPKGTLPRVWYKLQRIWKIRWKHPLVYEEWWLPALVTRVWCWVKNEQIIMD